MTEKTHSQSSAAGARVLSAAQSSTSTTATYFAGNYPKVQLRGFYSEVLEPDAERRLGVSNFIFFSK